VVWHLCNNICADLVHLDASFENELKLMSIMVLNTEYLTWCRCAKLFQKQNIMGVSAVRLCAAVTSMIQLNFGLLFLSLSSHNPSV